MGQWVPTLSVFLSLVLVLITGVGNGCYVWSQYSLVPKLLLLLMIFACPHSGWSAPENDVLGYWIGFFFFVPNKTIQTFMLIFSLKQLGRMGRTLAFRVNLWNPCHIHNWSLSVELSLFSLRAWNYPRLLHWVLLKKGIGMCFVLAKNSIAEGSIVLLNQSQYKL